MKLTVLGSSSQGNCYLLHNKEECLVIEAGIPFKEVKKALNFDISTIVGVLVSHEHGDHAKYVDDYIRAGIPVNSSKGTIEARDSLLWTKHSELEAGNLYSIGSFSVKPLSVEHDCADPFAFYIYHKDIGHLLFATDTYYIRYKFSGLNHILVECNYSQEIIDKNCYEGIVNKALRDRTMASHFELENVKEFLRVNDSNSLKNVVLLHLSDRNSDARLFQTECKNVTNKPTYIAEPGLTINLDLVPF